MSDAPRISLVIPAYNEAAYLPALLDSVDRARDCYGRGSQAVEVIVADNASTDETASLARARGCRVVRVEKRVIGAARNGGARVAAGEIVCFVDADSRIHPDTFNEIERTLANNKVIAGATGIRPDRWSLGVFVTFLIAAPLALALRVDAGVVFCRRADFERIGGYSETRLYAEDLQLLFDLWKLGRPRGQRLVRATRARAIASTRKFDKYGEWHYVLLPFRLAWYVVRGRGEMNRWVRRYWYEDR